VDDVVRKCDSTQIMSMGWPFKRNTSPSFIEFDDEYTTLPNTIVKAKVDSVGLETSPF
jgi:hypothetical protein